MERQSTERSPLVSFVIAYYELPVRLLRACVESILALSLSEAEREIIIVDDGSRESPLQALGDLANQLIYVRKAHGGLSEARNTGIRLSRGEYLQFVDADDRLLPSAYDHCLDQVRFAKADMVMFEFSSQDDEPSATFTTSEPQTGIDLMRRQNIRGAAWGYLFSRSILGDLRFPPGIWHEDEEFTPLLLLRAERVVMTSARAYFYLRRPESIITSTNIRNRLRRLNDMKGVILRLHETADRLPTESRLALQRRVAQLTMDYLYNTIRQTQSRHHLDRRIEELSRHGLFPLPDRDYTQKYIWFRRLIDSTSGRALLLRIIPLLPKEQ